VVSAVSVASERCIGCGVCESVCPMGVFSVVSGTATANSENCVRCGNCERSCPANCIRVGEAAEI